MIWLRRQPTAGLLPVDSLSGSVLRLRGGALRAVVECQTVAFGIKDEAEQTAVLAGWSSMLNSLDYPIQIVIRTRRLDPSLLATPDGMQPISSKLHDSYRRFIEQIAGERRVLDRRLYVIVPSSTDAHVLDQRVTWICECLRRIDLAPARLRAPEVVDLLRHPLDPVAAIQPVAPDDDLTSLSSLLAPAAVDEQPSTMTVSGRHARTIAISRYPSRLQPGWLGDLQRFDSDLDLALHVAPSEGRSVMSFLDRRIGELSSTIRIAEDRGDRVDPYRRAALRDAVDLQGRIADGSERLFDVSLYLTLWADRPDDLDAATRRLEALLGQRMIHTRRLLLQMRPGLVSSLPLGLDQVGLRKILSTTALSATFPFTGSDLATRRGVLYGVNTVTRSPVVVDRFALTNHNSIVLATSGAGKSFLVKVELVRAALGGVRALVIDPEGEYSSLIAGLGGLVHEIRPGSSAGLDPFRIHDLKPGVLDTRIAMLTAFIGLIADSLNPKQRAAVEDAIATVYARAGYADGASTKGLMPPRMSDVQARLRQLSGTESLAARLERYVTGSGRWLLAGANQADASASSAFVIRGVPQEQRVAAMFLVLDRIWDRLADSTQPTLVVVDEAWWLMRHADTAAFLFRLVKTARKRNAGLTLVTQDVGDVLARREGEAVINNSALQILMKQAPQAMPRLAELFRLTPAEQSWLLTAQRGEGLLVAQGKRVPFQVIATDEEAQLIEGNQRAA